MIIVISIVIGFLSAFVGSLVGLGGGIIFVPAMLFLFETMDSFSWATPQTIVGISLVTMIFTGLSSTLAYYKMKRIDMNTGLIFLIGSLPGSIIGAWLNKQLDTSQFTLYFGILMIIVTILLFIDREKLAKNREINITEKTRSFTLEGKTYQYNVPLIPALILSVSVGVLSGLFGIGGGTISVPAMILFFGMPIQIAIATSMFLILFISLFSASTHIFFGHIEWTYVLFFVIGSYIGGTVGAKTSEILKGKTLSWILRIFIMIAAIRLILS